MHKRLIFTLLALLLTLMPPLSVAAQTATPEPTAEATVSDAAPAPVATQEAPAIVIDTGDGGSVTIPVDETPEPAPSSLRLSMLEFALWTAAALLGGAVTAGGLAAFIMRDPARVKMLEQLGNSVPKEHADRVVGIVEIFVPILTLVREVFDQQPYEDKIAAGVTKAFSAERQRERNNRIAKAINGELNADPQNVTPLPPMGPLNG